MPVLDFAQDSLASMSFVTDGQLQSRPAERLYPHQQFCISFLLDTKATMYTYLYFCIFIGMKTNYENQFQEFRVRRICSITGKMLEMPILMIRRHFLLAHQAFKNHRGDRTLIPYLTESEYRFLFEGSRPQTVTFSSVPVHDRSRSRRAENHSPDSIWSAHERVYRLVRQKHQKPSGR